MKKIISLFIFILILNSINGFQTMQNCSGKEYDIININTNIRVLIIIPDRYGANTYFNMDNMELFGWNLTLAGLTEIIQPCPWAKSSFGLPELKVDMLINDIVDISFYDVLAIMPANWRSGEAYGDLINSRDTLNLISTAKTHGLVIWATCAGVRVLAEADVINGVKVTGRIQYKNEYERAGAIYLGESIPPVIDQNIVTCMRGQYWNKENIEAIATALEQRIFGTSKNIIINKENIKTTNYPVGGLWTKTYGGSLSDGGKEIFSSIEDEYVILGYTYSSELGSSDMYVICIDEMGNILWSETYGGSGWEYGYGICSSNNGGYLLTGYSTSFDINNSKDVFVVEIDKDGNELWSKTYGGSGLDIGRSICQSNNGYIICGYTESFGSGENDIYVIKINEEGNILWEKQYGGSGAELGYQTLKTSDNNYVIIGGSGSDRANYDFYFLKIDDDGNVIWENYYGALGGEGGYDRGHAVIETDDGDFLIIGETNYGDALNMLVVKTDSQGNDEWKRIYGEVLHDHGNDIIETSDGNFVICGRLDKTSMGNNDIGIIKINEEGDEVWRKTVSMSGSEWATSLIEANDNGLLFTGHTDSIGSGSYDIFVMKTDSEGNSNQQPDKPSTPNGPTSGEINELHTYSSIAIDPENEDIYYMFDWGDGRDSGWIGPYASGETCEASNIWEEQGDYLIRVKARDINGGESDWSEPLVVSMPKNKSFNKFNLWIFRFLHLLPIMDLLKYGTRN